MPTVNANGVAIGVESFGDDDAPLVLLAGGTTMLSWPDALCEHFAAGGCRVVRYDLRDSGESTTADPEAPAYSLRDLAADAAALADVLGGGPAHLAGIGVGGMVAQVAALDFPGAFSALTLAGTRAVAPGKCDSDLPDHDKATMKRLFTRLMPDWTDREAVVEFAAARAEILGDDPVAARAIAARMWDRTPGTAPPTQTRWPTSSAWSSPISTANPAGASARPGSRSPRSSSTAPGTRSSPSATARPSRGRFPGHGCSSSRKLQPRSPRRQPARSPRRCSRSGEMSREDSDDDRQ